MEYSGGTGERRTERIESRGLIFRWVIIQQ